VPRKYEKIMEKKMSTPIEVQPRDDWSVLFTAVALVDGVWVIE
jgi:hypothetical protein